MLSEQVWWWGKLQLVRISPLCRHAKEAWDCGAGSDSLGQLGDPVGQIQAAGIYMKAYLGLHFICNCLLDCRNCLLTSQIMGLYYKLKRSNKASAVYWLRGTLLYPCLIIQKRIQKVRQCTNLKSHSSGGAPHRPWCNVDSERGQVHLGFASVYLPPSSSTLRWSCTR